MFLYEIIYYKIRHSLWFRQHMIMKLYILIFKEIMMCEESNGEFKYKIMESLNIK